jgi:hypothetical protein
MRNVSDKSFRINQNISFSITFFPRKLCIYEIMWKNIVEPDRPQMQCEFWIPKATNTYLEYAIKGKGKLRYINKISGLDRRRGFQEVESPIFQDNRHMKVLRLPALRTGRLYLPFLL